MGEIELTQIEIETALALGVKNLDVVKAVKRRMLAREERQSAGLGAGTGLLDAEDVAFARLFQLSEADFIALAGGLPSYLKLRLDRKALRAAGKPVPTLPSTLTAADVIVMKQLDVSGTMRAKVELDLHKKAMAEALQSAGKGG
ncbi:MAG: hypothetical protein FJ012_07915 [Chloroflexi bacterium]|nr:hypothetical protein [Chloroflexota bacterium]